MSIMVRCRGADSESHMTKLMLTNLKYVTVDRNDKREHEMSCSVKVTLTSCFVIDCRRYSATMSDVYMF